MLEKFSVSSALHFIREKHPVLNWAKKVGQATIHPSLSSNVWKLEEFVLQMMLWKQEASSWSQDVVSVRILREIWIIFSGTVHTVS